MEATSQPKKLCKKHGEEIYAVCFNSVCNENKLVCFECLTDNLHFGHPGNFKKYSNLEEILNKQRIECNKLLSTFDELINEILSQYQKLKQGLDNKYNLPKERIKLIDNNNFSQYISNIIRYDEYSDNIVKLMKDDCKYFTDRLKNFVIELELDQLKYIETNKEDQLKAEKFYNQGYAKYYDKKHFEEAIKLFNKALIYNPKHIQSLWCKGVSLSKLEEYKESIKCFDEALAIDPFHISSLKDKGEALRKMNQFSFSIQFYDQKSLLETQHNIQHGNEEIENEWLDDYSIEIDILNKEKLQLSLNSSYRIDEIINIIERQYPKLLQSSKQKIIIKSKKNNRQFSPNETLRQILQDQANGKFFVEIEYGSRESKGEQPNYYIINFNILNKEQQELCLDSSNNIDEILEFLTESYSELLGSDTSRIMIKSKKMNRQLNPNEKIGQILQDQYYDKFYVELQQDFKVNIEVGVQNRDHILNFDPNLQLQELKEPILSKLKASFEFADVDFFIGMQPMTDQKLTQTLVQLGLNKNNITITAKIRSLQQTIKK